LPIFIDRLFFLVDRTTLRNIVVIGTSGRANSVTDILERNPNFALLGWIDTAGAPPDEAITRLVRQPGVDGIVFAVGDNFRRAKGG